MKPIGKKLKNIAKSNPVSEYDVKRTSDAQIFSREFVSDYDQIIHRISNAPTGLRSGSPPPTVT